VQTENHRLKEGTSVFGRLLLPLAALLLVIAASVFVLLPASSAADNPKLFANVGPGFTISLKDSGGNPVTHVDPGTYSIDFTDQSDAHNFHLSGPGVDQATAVESEETGTWTVTFTDGRYHFQCDAHPSSLKGNFTAGNPPPPPPPPPPPAKGKKLNGSVGPAFKISISPKRVKAGSYTVVVADKSSSHNFHLTGPGVNKKTSVGGKGKLQWKVTFKKGKTYRFRCDAHPTLMKGRFKAS
jgi:plastocyanin